MKFNILNQINFIKYQLSLSITSYIFIYIEVNFKYLSFKFST